MLWYLEQQENSCLWYLEQQVNKCYWYLEQQENLCPSFSCSKNMNFVIYERLTDQTCEATYHT